MSTLLLKIKKTLQRWHDKHVKSPLPVGMTEFDNYVSYLMSNYDLPTKQISDIKHMLSAMIVRLGPKDFMQYKYAIVLEINTAAAKQVASVVFQTLQAEHKAKMEAEKQKLKDEAEATAAAVANEQVQN